MATLSFIDSAKLVGLLGRADPQGTMKVRVLSMSRLAVGADPLKPRWIVDLSKEEIASAEPGSQISAIKSHINTTPSKSIKVTRRRGSYWLEIQGQRYSCSSLRDVLRTGCLKLEQISPGVLDELSKVKPRSKRIVARERKQLFESAELVSKYSEQLTAGWWLGTNNSASETNTWLRRAAECAGLEWGSDIQWGE